MLYAEGGGIEVNTRCLRKGRDGGVQVTIRKCGVVDGCFAFLFQVRVVERFFIYFLDVS